MARRTRKTVKHPMGGKEWRGLMGLGECTYLRDGVYLVKHSKFALYKGKLEKYVWPGRFTILVEVGHNILLSTSIELEATQDIMEASTRMDHAVIAAHAIKKLYEEGTYNEFQMEG